MRTVLDGKLLHQSDLFPTVQGQEPYGSCPCLLHFLTFGERYLHIENSARVKVEPTESV